MKKALVVGLVSIVALVGAACAFSNSGQAAGHRPFPTHPSEVEKPSGVVLLGSGRIKQFIWYVAVERGGGGPPCFDVSVAGPVHKFPGVGLGGEQFGETQCGLGPSQHARVLTVPVPANADWQPFDIGIAAYDTPVAHVRLDFSGGGREELRTRRMRSGFDISGIAGLRYAVFAVEGCASKISGLEKGRVVASAGDWECGTE